MNPKAKSEISVKELIAFTRSVYDYIIVDTPPLNLVIDGLLIMKHCDGTVLVVESGLTERAQADKAARQMEYAGIRVLGAVLNKAHVSRGHYGYGYSYGEKRDAESSAKRGKKK